MLFGVEGLQVTDAQALPDGTLEVWAVTGHPAAAACPDCGTVHPPHDTVLARPRDVRRGPDPVAVWWVKCRWKCEAPGCARKTFTERVPQVPPRCRLRPGCGSRPGPRSPSGASRHRRRPGTPGSPGRPRMRRSPPRRIRCWIGPGAGGAPGHRQARHGRPRWRIDEDTGEYELLADRWHTCFFDLSGDQGLLGQVEGRTADDAAYWLAQATPAWRHGPGGGDRHVLYLCLRGPPDAARCADRGGLVPRGAPGGQDDRRRAPPGGPRQVPAPRAVR